MEKIITLGYDVMTYNGEQPNCINPKFLDTIYRASDFYFSNSFYIFIYASEYEYSLFLSATLFILSIDVSSHLK